MATAGATAGWPDDPPAGATAGAAVVAAGAGWGADAPAASGVDEPEAGGCAVGAATPAGLGAAGEAGAALGATFDLAAAAALTGSGQTPSVAPRAATAKQRTIEASEWVITFERRASARAP